MKKVILSAFVVGSLVATSCKKAKEVSKDAVNKTEKVAKETVKKVEKVIDTNVGEVSAASKKLNAAIEVAKGMGVNIPSFEKPELTQNLADYAVYAKDYIAAKGNVAAITKLAPKGAELLKKGQELLKGADDATVKKFKTVLTALQAKMAPSKK